MIRRAIATAPEFPDAYNNLGNVLLELGRYQEAEGAYRKVIELVPGHLDARTNLGVALKMLDRIDEAETVLREAIELDPEHVDAWHNLGNVLNRQERREDAIIAFRSAIELRPFDARNYGQLGALYRKMDEPEQAAAVYRKWLENDPPNPVAAHLLAAIEGGDTPDRASNEFVQALFDPFAASFDIVLKGLQYQAPELVGDALAQCLGAPAAQLSILDAGCGAALCGPLLRPYARRLVGVDLSPAMSRKSSARGVYDELMVAELTAYLGDCKAGYEVIAAADTWCYFGALEAITAAAAGALTPGGHLVFTVEDAETRASPRGFRLEPHGRYSHREDYVRAVLAAAGLTVDAITTATLRQEADKPVIGLVVLAKRPA